MNTIFRDHVTNTAFFLSISKRQIIMLQIIDAGHCTVYDDGPRFPHYVGAGRQLCEKGMVVWVLHDVSKQRGHWELTKAGELTLALLREAGFESEYPKQEVPYWARRKPLETA